MTQTTDIVTRVPLSLAQHDIYLDQLRRPSNPLYNIGGFLRLGKIDVARLTDAHRQLVVAQDAFGMRLLVDGDGVSQYFSQSRDGALPIFDLSADANPEKNARQWTERLFETVNDYEDCQLCRSWLLKLAEDHYWYVCLAHHLAMDGWGFGNWIDCVATYYNGERPQDYTSWSDQLRLDSDYQDSSRFVKDREFWRQHCEPLPDRPLIPHYLGELLAQSKLSQRFTMALPRSLHQQLTEFGRSQGGTIAQVLLSALAGYFALVSQQSSLMFGIPAHNRKNYREKKMIGLFTTISPLLISVERDQSFTELFAQVVSKQKQAFRHQRMPIGQIARDLQLPGGDFGMFDVVFNYLKLDHSRLLFDGEPTEVNYISHNHQSEPLIVTLWDGDSHKDSMDLYLDYHLGYFSHVDIENLAERLHFWLKQLLENADQILGSLALVTPKERVLQLQTFGNSPRTKSNTNPVHRRFEQQVALTPDTVAACHNGVSLSYAQLNSIANSIAHQLRAKGVVAGSFVGISIARSLPMLAAVLAVLKTGAAYVPMDPSYPADRLRYLCDDAELVWLLCDGEPQWVAKTSRTLKVMNVGQLVDAESVPASDLDNNIESCDAAYLIYTSGSTGLPKGVLVSHQNVAALLDWSHRFYSRSELSRVLATTSLNFDISVFEMFAPLTCGGTVVVLDSILELIDKPELADSISLINTVPSAAAGLIEHGCLPTNTLTINLAGEALPRKLVAQLLAIDNVTRVVNAYGPTEDTVYSTVESMSVLPPAEPSIGRLIDGGKGYVLGQQMQLLPTGQPGELYLAGDGVSLGYWQRQALNAERFIADPFDVTGQSRMYRTGDVVRWLPDGKLAYLGRNDDQIKINGLRIELGEIDSVITQLSSVTASLTVAADRGQGHQQLISYVVRQAAQNDDDALVESIHGWLRKKLPKYMVPSTILVLSGWPLTANGKIDKKKLPKPELYPGVDDFRPAQTALQHKLQDLWGKLLGLPQQKISITASFFTLGGDSLLAVKMAGQIREWLKYPVVISEVFEFDSILSLSERLTQRFDQAHEPVYPIERVVERSTGQPLSYAQQRLWFIERFEQGGAQYHMSRIFEVRGEFDIEAMEQALQALVAQQSTLRTVYVDSEQGPMQQVCSDVTLELVRHKVDGPDAALSLAHSLVARPFDLSAELMLRADWLDLGEYGWLVLCLHHIAGDGVSIAVFVDGFVTAYGHAKAGKAPYLSVPTIEYIDYSQWQRNWMEGNSAQQQLLYWRKQLEGLPVVHSLPLKQPRPIVTRHQGQVLSQRFGNQLSARLKALAAEQQLTLFMLVHSAFALLLSRHSNSGDIVIGVPSANRLQPELANLVGCFINTLVLRTEVSDKPLSAFWQEVRQVHCDGQANQQLPFDLLVQHFGDHRSFGHSPLFQILLNMDMSPAQGLTLPGARVSVVAQKELSVRYDIELTLGERDGGLTLDWCYDQDLFDDKQIAAMAGHLHNLLQAMQTSKPDVRLSQLAMLDSKQVHYLCHTLNQPETPALALPDSCLHSWFERQVEQYGDAVALESGTRRLSYRELNGMVNQLAHYLRSQGVTSDCLVGLHLGRSVELLVAVLAVCKAGGAYVALDPAYPQQRLDFILQDCKPLCVLSDQAVLPTTSLPVLRFDDQTLAAQPNCNLRPVNRPGDLAYVIYTSGSTGQPKGVMVEQHNVLALLAWSRQYFNAAQLRRTLASTSLNFDVSVFELLAPLGSGGTVVMVGSALSLLEQKVEDLTLISTVPSAARALLDAGAWPQQSMTAALAGEALPQALVAQLLAQPNVIEVMNLYGPTEDTVYSTACRFNQAPQGNPSIGWPINGSAAYVLDRDGELAPFGAPGELYLAGCGVSRGYLNQPTLTAQRFIEKSLGSVTQRLYRTGDLVRYLPDGSLEYLGRVDQQVKVRGYRIEPGEIAYQLGQMVGVKHVVVSPYTQADGQQVLVAYVQSNAEQKLDLDSLKQQLGQVVPGYTVPDYFIAIEQWPLTLNGKVDHKALPEPNVVGGNYVAPQTDTQLRLRDIWSQLLGLPNEVISAGCSFFALGGHSLLAVRLGTEISRQFDLQVPVRVLFEQDTIVALAGYIDSQQGLSEAHPITAVCDLPVSLPLSSAQQRMWLLEQMDNREGQYNMCLVLAVSGSFDLSFARQALSMLAGRHEALRTRFPCAENDVPVQQVYEATDVELTVHDLSGLSAVNAEYESDLLIKQLCVARFDLSNENPLKVDWINLPGIQTKGQLVFNLHHIAGDGWSVSILVDEFCHIYNALKQDLEIVLEPLPLRYGDFTIWQQKWLQSEQYQQQLEYWQQQLAEMPYVHQLVSKPRQAVAGRTASYIARYDYDFSAQLVAMAAQHHLTLFMLFHGVFALLLSRYSGQDDIVIGTPVAGRAKPELANLVGCFINSLVLRVDTSIAAIDDYLAQVRQVNIAAQANQDLPFEHLVSRFGQSGNGFYNPLFQIGLNLQLDDSEQLVLHGSVVEPLPLPSAIAKFDLDLTIRQGKQALTLEWQYDCNLFEPAYIEGMHRHLTGLFEQFLSSASSSIPQLSILDESERKALITTIADVQSYGRDENTIADLFGVWVARQPDQVALIFGTQSYSYGEVDRLATNLACYLQANGVFCGDSVALCGLPQPCFIIAVIAIIKAGACYLPLDANYPDERLAWMLSDAKPAHLLLMAQAKHCSSLVDNVANTLLSQDFLASLPEGRVTHGDTDSRSLAYLQYTSGSTGQPKGIKVSHSNWLAFQRSLIEVTQSDLGNRVLQFSSVSFDIFVQELSLSLLCGGTLVLRKDPDLPTASQFWQLIKRYQISLAGTPTAYWHQLCQDPKLSLDASDTSLRLFIVGGEAMSAELLSHWRSVVNPEVKLYNGYGPSETTVAVTMYDTGDAPIDCGSVPLGSVLSCAYLMVLDRHGQLVPQNVVGELHIGGHSVGQGYINQNELSARQFIDNPFSNIPSDKLYRSGDLVRYDGSGNLLFVGRRDNQFKHRGYRIEPGEIEQRILAFAGVLECLVLLRQQKLMAYFIADDSSAQRQMIAALTSYLTQHLPHYLIPDQIVELTQWPLTTNGKIDRAKLPQFSALTQLSPQDQTQRTRTEHQLAELWAQLLDVQAENLHGASRFFELGGHSLLAVRLVGLVAQHFKRVLTLKLLFEHSTLATMALYIEQAPYCDNNSDIKPIARDQRDYPLSPSQQRLWFVEQLQPGHTRYQIPVVLKVTGLFDIARASAAMQRIIRRHEPLRTNFVQLANEPRQVPNSDFDFHIDQYDLSKLTGPAQQQLLQALIEGHQSSPFDLGSGLLVRLGYACLGGDGAQQQGVLLFNVHHIVVDGWSMGLLVKEFSDEYAAIGHGHAPQEPLPVQYIDFVQWQRQQREDMDLARGLAYWVELLADAPATHELPSDGPRSADGSNSAVVLTRIGSQTMSQIAQINRDTATTPFMLLHSVLALHIGRYSDSTEVVLGAPHAGRSHPATESMIGLFLDVRVHIHRFGDNPDLPTMLRRTREQTMENEANGNVPFEAIVSHLQPSRALEHAPIFQILVNQDNTPSYEMALDGVCFAEYGEPRLENKYDLTLYISELDQKGEVTLRWVYDGSLFSAVRMADFADSFYMLLKAVLAEPQRQVLNHEWHGLTPLSQPVMPQYSLPGHTLAELIEVCSQEQGEVIAISCNEGQWSYRELNALVNQLAHGMKALGVGPHSTVVLALERDHRRIVAILAILKLGGCFVPLSCELPSERLYYMCQIADPQLVLTNDSVSDVYRQAVVDCCCVHSIDWVMSLSDDRSNPPLLAVADDWPAHIIFTSGSTGLPKGVVGSYGATFNRIAWMLETFPWQRGEAMAHITSMAFIRGIWELLVPLCGGVRLRLYDRNVVRRPDDLWPQLNREGITRIVTAPSLMKALTAIEQDNPVDKISLHHWFVSGEPLDTVSARKLMDTVAGIRLYNLYGSTEVMSDVLWYRVSGSESQHHVPVGAAVSGVGIAVVGPGGQLLPAGLIGELEVSGAALGCGYLPDNLQGFVNTSRGRVFRTGDRGRMIAPGVFECLGRRDDQIKIRGYRIALGEIEQQLLQLPEVSAAVVLASKDVHGETIILSYVITDGSQVGDVGKRLLPALATHLPGYMLPRSIIALTQWPLKPNGKIDKKALPPWQSSRIEDTKQPPQGATETALASIWASLLGYPQLQVGRMDHFFEQGGHSLLAVRLATEVGQLLDCRLPIALIFTHPTLAALAGQLDEILTTQALELGFADEEVEQEDWL